MIWDIIQKTLYNNQFVAKDEENESILDKILKTDGLDIRDKISGVIGSLKKCPFKF